MEILPRISNRHIRAATVHKSRAGGGLSTLGSLSGWHRVQPGFLTRPQVRNADFVPGSLVMTERSRPALTTLIFLLASPRGGSPVPWLNISGDG